jgi:hypothetical protein
MESTGIYWIPIYELLEAQQILPFLVNARHVKNVPGRKSDWNDAQWLQKLHALGLLRASFRPDAEICALRALVRYRAELIQHRAPHVQHMQQALKVMNLQLSEVLTDVVGTTGLAILRAIAAGERDPLVLAQHRAVCCRASSEMIAKALTGTWKDEQIFVLQQALTLYDAYTSHISACDAKIEALLTGDGGAGSAREASTGVAAGQAQLQFEERAGLQRPGALCAPAGVDLVAVTGLSAATVQTISARLAPI